MNCSFTRVDLARRLFDRLGAGIAVIVAAAALTVAGVADAADEKRITAEMLLAGAPLGAPEDSANLVDDEDVLAVSPEMRAFLDMYVDDRSRDMFRLQQLTYAIINEGTFGLEYADTTRTAAQTFHLRSGNCLSFSNMFVAMARAVGLGVSFQEVDIPPDWTYRNDAFVLNRHVNVYVDLGTAGEHVVDFNVDDFKTTYDRQRISDTRALAHYYNNVGVEHMQTGDSATALAYYRRAIADNERQFAPAWANLGMLYLRQGHFAYAEAAFLQALKVDPKHSVAMSNLVGLYESLGDSEQAAEYRKRVERHRKMNPYYRYSLAREAFLARDYDTAIDNLKYAIRKREREDQFLFLLGLCYLQKGNDAAARKWLERAEEVAATDALKRNYSNKMDMLLSSPK